MEEITKQFKEQYTDETGDEDPKDIKAALETTCVVLTILKNTLVPGIQPREGVLETLILVDGIRKEIK